MKVHVDWLSFSLYPELLNWGSSEAQRASVENALRGCLGSKILNVLGWQEAEIGKGRAPHVYSWRVERTGLTVFVAPVQDRILVEMTGRTCGILDGVGMLNVVLKATGETVTRIDIACDIETEKRPEDFVKAGYSGRFKSGGHYYSSTGETVYVGSRNSDRYARVYKYKEPHDRAKYLRIEYVFKRLLAKTVSARIAQDGIESAVMVAGTDFGWKTSLWVAVDAVQTTIDTVRRHRSNDKTLAWLENSAAPAFRRLVREGGLPHPVAWIEQNLLIVIDDD